MKFQRTFVQLLIVIDNRISAMDQLVATNAHFSAAGPVANHQADATILNTGIISTPIYGQTRGRFSQQLADQAQKLRNQHRYRGPKTQSAKNLKQAAQKLRNAQAAKLRADKQTAKELLEKPNFQSKTLRKKNQKMLAMGASNSNEDATNTGSVQAGHQMGIVEGPATTWAPKAMIVNYLRRLSAWFKPSDNPDSTGVPIGIPLLQEDILNNNISPATVLDNIVGEGKFSRKLSSITSAPPPRRSEPQCDTFEPPGPWCGDTQISKAPPLRPTLSALLTGAFAFAIFLFVLTKCKRNNPTPSRNLPGTPEDSLHAESWPLAESDAESEVSTRMPRQWSGITLPHDSNRLTPAQTPDDTIFWQGPTRGPLTIAKPVQDPKDYSTDMQQPTVLPTDTPPDV